MAKGTRPLYIRGLSPAAYRWLKQEARRLEEKTGVSFSLPAVIRRMIEAKANGKSKSQD